MRAIYLLLGFCALTNLCKAQRYEHFINNTKQWKSATRLAVIAKSTKENGDYFALRINYFEGDTLINETTYQKTYIKQVLPQATDTTTELSDIYLYEDTVNRKVFILDPFYANKNVLLYDFGLMEGDSVHTYVIGNIYNHRKVLKTDSVSLQNKLFRRITFTDGIEWIEGVGSTTNLRYPTGDLLICVKDNNQELYVDTAYFQNCDTVFTDSPPAYVNKAQQSAYKVSVFPNPITETTILTIHPKAAKPFTVQIFNTNGELVNEGTCSDTYPIGTILLHNGLYLCRILYRGVEISNQKIVVTHN